MPAGSNLSYQFAIAKGAFPFLTKGYIIYGKRWDATLESPFGGPGWYEEVLCYCGPKDHQAFTNGKYETRKNLWLPYKKVDVKKSMKPQRFLSRVKRLK